MGFESPSHWVIIAIVVVVLFGYKKLPEMSRSVGRSLRIFKTEIKGMGDDDSAREAAAGEQPVATATPVVTPTPAATPTVPPAAPINGSVLPPVPVAPPVNATPVNVTPVVPPAPTAAEVAHTPSEHQA